MDINELYRKWKSLPEKEKMNLLQSLSVEEKLEFLIWIIKKGLKEDCYKIFILLSKEEKKEIIALFLRKSLLEWWIVRKGTRSPLKWEYAVAKFQQVNALLVYYYDEIAKKLFEHLPYIMMADIIDATKDKVDYELLLKVKDDPEHLLNVLHGITLRRYSYALMELEMKLRGIKMQAVMVLR